MATTRFRKCALDVGKKAHVFFNNHELSVSRTADVDQPSYGTGSLSMRRCVNQNLGQNLAAAKVFTGNF